MRRSSAKSKQTERFAQSVGKRRIYATVSASMLKNTSTESKARATRVDAAAGERDMGSRKNVRVCV
eukprot:8069568-Pyramimonas_sp.AAC.1